MTTPSILVADRDDIQRQLIDMLLAVENYRVVTVADGRGAMGHLRDHTPDLAILDLELPATSGADLCEKMKSIPRLADVPVILIAPAGDDANPGLAARTRELARIVRADLLLQRPLGDKNLRERVQQLLEARSAPAGRAVPGRPPGTSPLEAPPLTAAPESRPEPAAEAAPPEREALRPQRAKLTDRVEGLGEANRELREALAAHDERLARLRDRHQEAMGEIAALRDRVLDLERRAAERGPGREELEEITSSQAREIESLTKRNRLLLDVLEEEKSQRSAPRGNRSHRNGK